MKCIKNGNLNNTLLEIGGQYALWDRDNEVFVVVGVKEDQWCSGVLADGSAGQVAADSRIIVAWSIAHKFDKLVMAHNHPGRHNPMPSPEDLASFYGVQLEMRSVGIEVLDHFIFGGDQGVFSIGTMQRYRINKRT